MQLHDVPQANILYDLGMLTPGNAQEETDLNLAPFKPAIYRILVVGMLDRNWSNYFRALSISTAAAPDHDPVTTLTGKVADQADLVSIITALYGLGLPLLAVECLATEPFPAASVS